MRRGKTEEEQVFCLAKEEMKKMEDCTQENRLEESNGHSKNCFEFGRQISDVDSEGNFRGFLYFLDTLFPIRISISYENEL